MTNDDIVRHMICFVENLEKAQQSNQFLTGTQMKNDTVKAILDELEREVPNADS